MYMQLYSNIKRRRKQLNMSQQELAEAVGYKGKSMIAQIENGRVALPAPMIKKFADVFGCSISDLIGDTATNSITIHNETDYIFDLLSDENRQRVVDYAKKLLEIQKMENCNNES